MNAYRLMADVIVLIHALYVAFVVFGLVAIVIGLARRRPWARNVWLRGIHLAMIAIVVVEAWLGIPCPLTVWENRLRKAGGQGTYAAGFLENAFHKILFFRLPAWAFAVGYSAFGLAVLATFLVAPPRRRAVIPPSASNQSTPS